MVHIPPPVKKFLDTKLHWFDSIICRFKAWKKQREVERTLKNSPVSAISFLNNRVVKNMRGRVTFQILYLMVYSNKFFKSRLKTVKDS